MDVTNFLESQSVVCAAGVTSKKHALDILSHALSAAAEGLKQGTVLDALMARERLGSTALGNRVAVPHARIPGLEQAVGAFLKLEEGVEFDAADGQPVDLLFGLLIPQDEAESGLDLLRKIMDVLRDPETRRNLHGAGEPQRLHTFLTSRLTKIQQTINV